MDYDETFGVTCKLKLQTGRALYLESLNQCRTYLGLSEGFPSKKLNDMIVAQGQGEAARVFTGYGEPYLIPPERRDYREKPGDMDFLHDRYLNRPEHAEYRRLNGLNNEWLPLVRCIACFMSIAPARDFTKEVSGLIVVWFQDDFALPIAEPIIESLQQIDWKSLATDLGLD